MNKQFLRWLILGVTLFFLGNALKDNWSEVIAIQIDAVGWAILSIATGVTLLAHIWGGWIWTGILRELNQSVPSGEFIQVYLKTNMAKYLPGNVWHYYGRIVAAKNAHIPAGAATLSVLLEPLLMVAAALIIIVVFGSEFADTHSSLAVRILQFLSLAVVLFTVHPRFLNLAISFVYKLKVKRSAVNTQPSIPFKVKRYPVLPLLGELGFLLLRGAGFILTVFALTPLNLSQLPLLLGAFSFAWLLGLVVPGAPGGLGVFEVTAIALLQHYFPAAMIISAIASYRLISIIAETAGAALASLDERLGKVV
ncbi:lysylphosphatidylglycerol synthase domain-containing protein [Nodularia harveyana UHCC-0300]|uniref:Lysylphosphatidylglycerol synthase domain-containing protein n=1 Tax=Nodularia harveyana UHCC-0300 TaxID=2974287 RepID=A0ABU5UH29_9CYAN|nr:lysylphosphatidylglycerol synthase domain-containing protein [Nodularia harveyana]MEA5582862.1 lysylphosphatidylglycerol synthase domain-containing protein [Nodularia harveyana UHCC-0300]